MRKLYVELNGGLGNQLFIVSSAISLAKKSGMEIVIDTSFFNSYKLRKVEFNKFIKNVKIEDKSLKIKNKKVFKLKSEIFYFINEKKIGYDASILNRLNQKKPFFNYYIKGYLQSLSYFNNLIPFLKEEFRKNILESNNELNDKKIKSILEKSVAIHIRRTDYEDKQGSPFGWPKLINENGFFYTNILSKDEVFRVLNNVFNCSQINWKKKTKKTLNGIIDYNSKNKKFFEVVNKII